MNTELHNDDANERHERNKRAMRYIDDIAQRDIEQENEWRETWRCRTLGCVCVLAVNAVIWWAIYCIADALGML